MGKLAILLLTTFFPNLIDVFGPNLPGSISRWLGFSMVQMIGLGPRGAEGWGSNGEIGLIAINDFFSESE